MVWTSIPQIIRIQVLSPEKQKGVRDLGYWQLQGKP